MTLLVVQVQTPSLNGTINSKYNCSISKERNTPVQSLCGLQSEQSQLIIHNKMSQCFKWFFLEDQEKTTSIYLLSE